jgi:vacuolar-type H+-ATPase subunit F/Vma7
VATIGGEGEKKNVYIILVTKFILKTIKAKTDRMMISRWVSDR